jgi:chromosome segregation ATPase
MNMPNATTNASGATEQIENLQRQIEQLRHRAILELKVKLAEARALVVDLQNQIEKISGTPAEGKPAATRKRRTSVTIAQVVEAIKGGATNYRSVAAKLGTSSATVAKKIKAEGKAAGIGSTGRKAAFKLIVK